MDKLLQTCGHERTDDGNRRMAPAQDTGNLLETMEKGEDEVPKLKSVETRRVAGASDSQQPEGLLEDSADVKCCPHQ